MINAGAQETKIEFTEEEGGGFGKALHPGSF